MNGMCVSVSWGCLLLAVGSVVQAQDTTLAPVVTRTTRLSTATRMEADTLRLPFATTIVERDQMDAVGAITLEDTLRRVPGLQHGTQGNYYTRFETRGLRDTRDVLMLIDGVPLRIPQGNVDTTLIAPDMVDRIEFIKGPASALYGRGAIGGVVQFFMRPERAGGEVATTVGSFGRTDVRLRYRHDFTDGHLYMGVANNHYNGFQRGAGRDQRALLVGGEYVVLPWWITGFQLYDTHVHANRGSIIPLENGRPMFGITSRDNFAIPGSHITGDYRSLTWKNTLRLSRAWELSHLSSWTRYNSVFEAGITIVPPPAAVTRGYAEYYDQNRGVLHELSLSHLSAGASWTNEFQVGLHQDRSWQDRAQPAFSGAPTYRGPDYHIPVSNAGNDPRGIRGAITDSRFDQEVRSAYLQNRFEWARVGITAGLRYDTFEQSLARSNTALVSRQKSSRTSPRLGFDWMISESEQAAHSVFVNWAKGFRPQAVAFNTINNVVLPTILRPELTRSTEVGLKGRAADGTWSYQISLFQSDKTDGQRSYRNGPDSFIFSNATSRVRGVESQAQWRISPHWDMYAHYTWQDARLRDFQTYTNTGVPSTNFGGYRVRMSARHIAGLGLSWKQDDWMVSLTSNYVGSRMLRDNTVDPQKLPGYLLVHAAVSYQVSKPVTVQVGVNNLTNKYYIGDDLSAQNAGNAGAPRTLFARLRYAF